MAQDARIAFAQSLIDRYIQFKLMQRQERMFERREQRYERQLQENRRYNQQMVGMRERHFAQTEDRLRASTESLIEQRGRPERGTKEWALLQGYTPEEAQLYQDRYNKLAPPMFTPQQKVTVGKMMMENPLTTDMYNSGKKIMEEGMLELQSQNVAFPSRPGAEESIEFRTTRPIGSGVFRPKTPDTGATILGGDRTQDFLPPDPDKGMFDRLEERVQVQKQGKRFTIPKSQIEQALAEGYELVEK